MGTMNISLPDSLRAFVEERVSQGGYSSSSEYVRELIRREQDRTRFRSLLLEGAESPAGPTADAEYFATLEKDVARASRR